VSDPVIGVLALQGDVREHQRMLAAVGARSAAVRSEAELAAVDAIIVPGGESSTMDKLARAFGLLDPLRDRIRAGLPAYGSCAGMIMLADTLVDAIDGQQTIGGIDIVVRRNAFGRQVDSFETPLRPAGGLAARAGPAPLHAVFIRAPWVESIGPQVEALASIETGPAAGRIVAVRHGLLLANSFHPELTGDSRVHEFFVEMVRAA